MEETKISIVEFLKPQITISNSLLDVGCGSARYLFEFNKIGFNNIVGVDSNPRVNPVGNYMKYLRENLKISMAKAIEIRNSDENWFTFYNCNYSSYFKKFSNEKYSLIICRNVLHFLSDDEKYDLINSLYSRLEKDGLLYIELNKNTHPIDTNPKLSNLIKENVYEGFTNGVKTLRYLADETEFNNRTTKLNPIKSIYYSDECIIKAAFRKGSDPVITDLQSLN